MPRPLKMLFLTILFLIAGVYLLIRYLESTSVFFPSRAMSSEPSHMGLKFDDVYFKAKDGATLNGWFVPAANSKATIIFAHGNAGNMSDRAFKLKFFHDLGLNVFIFDYRGYGKSVGRPSERGLYLDAQAAFDYVSSRADIDPKKIIGYGASLGGAVIIDLALFRPLSAIIIDSSFSSAPDMGHLIYPYLPTFMMSIKFDSASKVKKLTIPKLFLHSKEDRTVPFFIGQRLYEAAAGPKEFLQLTGGHNDSAIITDPAALATLRNFLTTRGLL